MRAALIKDGIVENLIVVESVEDFIPEDGYSVVDIEGLPVEIGSTYDGVNFNAPVAVVPVPESVTPLQMRKALRAIGLKPLVDQFIQTLNEETVEEWEYATSVVRGNPTIAMAAAGLGMTEEQVDDLFRLAASQT